MDRQDELMSSAAAAKATGWAIFKCRMCDGGARLLVVLAALLGFTQTAQAQ